MIGYLIIIIFNAMRSTHSTFAIDVLGTPVLEDPYPNKGGRFLSDDIMQCVIGFYESEEYSRICSLEEGVCSCS